MDEITDVATLRARLRAERASGRSIAFVPTMGYLHAGHLSLVGAARDAADVVVLSAFVNPLQFGPDEDFERYPRDGARDRELARAHGVHIFFAPSVAEMYPESSELRVTAGEVGSRLEGAVRPGHFDGVLTVVAKLFNIVAPDVTCFGQKDIQQVTLVRRMINALDFPIRLVVVPIMREADGLAMSSRNVYLSRSERTTALALWRGLHAAERAWHAGERQADRLRALVEHELGTEPAIAADYVALVDPHQLLPVAQADAGAILAVAARVGRTRLIDNIIFGPPGA